MELSLWIDERPVLESHPLTLSACNEASVRIASGPNAACEATSSLWCLLSPSHVDVQISPEPDDWVSMGSRHGRSSMAIDVPGFTLCFDACVDAHRRELSTVRVMHHKSAATSTSDVASEAAADEGAKGAWRPDENESCFEVGSDSLPTFATSAHGAWLRDPHSRDAGPPARAWPAVLRKASLDALRNAALALVHEHGCGGKTYWQDAMAPPRCLLEQAALEVLAFHSSAAAAAPSEHAHSPAAPSVPSAPAASSASAFLGAEWWVQLREQHAAPEAAAPAPALDVDDASSIAFHFDCDEGLYSATGELVPPWLSTVTYLSSIGAPTLILPARADADGAGTPTDGGAFLSFPHSGKHLCFDGTLLHGCPHALAAELAAWQEQEAAATTAAVAAAPPAEEVRLTLLVNLWQRHRPVGPQPLPRRIAEALGMALGGEGDEPAGRRLLVRRPAAAAGSTVAIEADAASSPRCFAPSDVRLALSPAAQTANATRFPTAAALGAAMSTAPTAAASREGLLHAPAVQLVV